MRVAMMDDLMHAVATVDVPTASEQDRKEVRLLTLVLTGSFLNDLLEPLLYFYGVQTSTLHKIVSLTHAPALVLGVLVIAAIWTVPHFISLLCLPQRFLNYRLPRRMACMAAIVSTLFWFYMAVLALPVDAGPLSVLYGRNALGALVVAFLYAVSLNAQQLRRVADRLFV